MPPNPPPVKGKPGGKGLTKKVGPFSLWVWVVIGAGGFAAYWFLIRGRGGGDSAYGGPEVVSGSGGATPQDMAGAGAPSTATAPSDMLSPDVLAQLQSQIGDVRGHVTELEDAVTQQGYTQNEDKTWNPPGVDVTGDQGFFGPNDPTTAPQQGGGKRGPRGPRGRPGKPGKPGKTTVVKGKHTGGKVKGKTGGKAKVTHPHPAAAAHPSAHPGAHRNAHPTPKKVVHKQPAPQPVRGSRRQGGGRGRR